MYDRLRELSARLWAWLCLRSRDRDFDAELDSHMAMAIDDEIARGTPPDEARRRALVRIGGISAAREQHRDARGWPEIESLWRDIQGASRLLVRNPGFTLVAVLSLALGIGSNTAIFSILNSLVLRPLPVHEPARLVQLHSGPDRTGWTYPLWEEIRSRADLFDGVAGWSPTHVMSVSLIDGGVLEPVAFSAVNGGFFDTLGIRPQVGRLLGSADDAPGSQAVVLSDAFWRRRFGGDPNIVGRSLQLSGALPATVVGVAPPDFFGLEVGQSFDMMAPIESLNRGFLQRSRTFQWLSIVARLKPGQTAESATMALQALQPAMRAATMPEELRPQELDAYLSAPVSATQAETGLSTLRMTYKNPLSIVMAAVGLVLLIACANIANLLLARADSRRHELAVRLALGASRGRLVRQLLIESVLLASVGGMCGLLMASWGGRVLVQQFSTPANLVTLDLPLDWRVLGFTAATVLVTSTIFGVVPALRATRLAPRAALVEKGRSVAGPANARLAHGLIVAQVSLSFVLVVGAGLLIRSFTSLARFDLGFDPRPVLSLSVRPNPNPAANVAQRGRINLDGVLEAVRAVPGVEAAAFGDLALPMSGTYDDSLLEDPHGLSLSEPQRRVFLRGVGPGWFTTMSMQVVLGRDFNHTDNPTAQPVVIVNQALARLFFPGRSPIGETLRNVSAPNVTSPPLTIVGVVNDAVYNSVRQGAPPTMYRLLPGSSTLAIRVKGGDPAAIRRSVTEAITQAEPALIVRSQPLFDYARATVARERLVAILSALFAVLALGLASVGIYGVLAFAVSRRRSEIAVRRALGAPDSHIVRLVLGRSVWLVTCGTAIGLIGSYWLTRFLQPLLYELKPRDPFTIAIAVIVLTAVGLLAGWLPARRARRIDPAAVLREG